MKKVILISAILILFAGTVTINMRATKTLFETQPSWYFLNLNSYTKMLHITGIGLGFRTLIADFEYINFLQYYGDKKNIETRFEDTYTYLDDITNADPHFIFAYTYGTAILAFNQRKYDQAVKLIKKGLKYNPRIWKLRLYLGAIMFQQEGKTLEYMGLLEETLQYDDHPAMVERILGNIYENVKTPDEAVIYWININKTSKDKETREFAYKRIRYFIENRLLADPGKIMKLLEE